MALCFWQLCDCPGNTSPCTQHGGHGCGLFSGNVVHKLEDVTDGETARLERALQTTISTRTKLEDFQKKAEDTKKSFEDLQQTLEQRFDKATTDAEKQKVNDDGRTQLGKVRRDVDEARLDFDAASLLFDVDVLAGVLGLLHRPFKDPTADCACAFEKLKRLAALDKQIATESTNLATAQNNLVWWGQKIAAAVALFVAAIALTVTWGIITWFKIAFLLKAANVLIIAAIVMAIAVLAIVIAIYVAWKKVLDLRKKLLELALQYYRLERISRCQ